MAISNKRTPLLFAAFCSIILILSGCDLVGSNEEEEPRLETTGVLVANGGNFSEQNGFITVYDPTTDQTANPPALQLNAFINSLTLRSDTAYAVLNTGYSSGRIDAIDLDTYERDQISDLGGVRSLAFTEEGRAYATVGDGTVLELDRNAGTTADEVSVGTRPEGIVATDDRLFVANYGSLGAGTTLSVIDPATNEVTSTPELGCDGPNELFVDGEGELVVVCQGKTVYNEDYTEVVERTNGQILFLDPTSQTVVHRIELDVQISSANGTQSAYYADEGELLFAISNGNGQVLRVDTDRNALSETVTVPASEDLVGLSAVAYDATTNQLYLARLPVGDEPGQPDYTAEGAVIILDDDGALVDRFTVGPAPSHIALRREER